MSAISLKSITGITSITTPSGVDNVFTVHTNDTTERFRIDQTGNLNIAGIVTVTKDLDVDGHTNLDNVSIAGVTTFSSSVHVSSDLDVASDIRHIGDTDTRLRFETDTISARTAGSERLRIDSTGNMGLGVSNPNILNEPAKFQELTLGGKTEGAGIHLKDVDGNVQGGMFTSDNTGAMIIRTITNHYMQFRTNNTERLRIKSDGKVLITNTLGLGGATSSPSGLLHCQAASGEGLIKVIGATNGVIQLSGYNGDSTINFGDASSDSPGQLNYDHGTDSLAIKTGGGERIRITSDGKIGIGNIASPVNNVEIRTDAHGEGVTIKSTGNTSNALTFDANRGTEGVIGVVYGRWNGTTVAQMSFISGLDGTDKNDGDITFGTESAASNGNVNATERLRIKSTGQISAGGGGTAWGNALLSLITPSGRSTAFDASDGDTWHDMVIKNTSGATNNAVGLAFQVTGQAYHKNAGTGICAVKNGTNSDYGADLVFITRPQNAVAEERLRITSGGQVNIGGDYTQTSYQLAVTGSAKFRHSEADIWLESTGGGSTYWRILGSTGGSTHQFRIYDQTNTADRLVIDSSGRVIIGDTSTTNASSNADNLVISGSGQVGMTIHSSNSSYSQIYFSDGTGSNQYIGYCQYNHSSNHLNLGAGGAQRVMLYDKDGANATAHSVLQVGGSSGNNHYNAISNASITFGGGNDIENYFIGVRRENVGGDYTKLDLRWHTGIRMGAQQNYGGIRFYDNEDLGSVKFSVMYQGDFIQAFTTLRPGANNTYDLGQASYRWRNVYTNDLNLSNEGSTNSVDNTWGNYTIQEGESDLFLINNRNGKKYRFNLTEVS